MPALGEGSYTANLGASALTERRGLNPHDKFFKDIWSRPDVAWDFLLNYLPPPIAARLVPGSLQLQKDSFVDAALQEHFSDLLYLVQLQGGGEALVYFLLEHKSHPDAGTPFQLLKYMVQIWDQDRQRKVALRPIIPVVLYHGRTAWNVARSFADLFPDGTGLEAYLPAFHYELCDVSHLPDEAIQGMVILRVTLLVLKYIFRPELRSQLPEVMGLLRELGDKRSGLEYLQVLLKYLAVGTDALDAETLRKAVKAALAEPEETIMATVAETWVQEGLQQGLEKATRESILEILEIRFGSLPEKVSALLNRVKDLDRLKQLHREALQVDSLEAFNQGLH